MHGRYCLKIEGTSQCRDHFSIILGIGAGVMFYYPDMKHTLIGILLLMWANHYDSADANWHGLQGRNPVGRMLDGFAGDIWFFTIYAAICLRLMDQPMPFHIGDGMHWGIFIWILAAFRALFVIVNNVHWRIIIVIFIYIF